MGAEYARLHLAQLLTCGLHEEVEQAAALLRGRRGGKAGPQTLGGVGCEGKLRYQQQFPLNLHQAEVHFPRVIGKYPVLQQSLEKPARGRLVIRRPDTQQHQQPGADGSYDVSFD